MPIYDLTGHPQLDPVVAAQGADYVGFQTLIAEAVLGATEPPYEGEALDKALAALVLQVNYQEATGTDARALASSSRLGITFRTAGKSGLPVIADEMALKLWSSLPARGTDGTTGGSIGDGWKTVRGVR